MREKRQKNAYTGDNGHEFCPGLRIALRDVLARILNVFFEGNIADDTLCSKLG